MLIRKIMKSIAIVILSAIVICLTVLVVKYWDIARWLLLMALCINFVSWLLNISVFQDEMVDSIDSIWNKINLTIYTAGLYWVGYGIYRLWKDAEKIEAKIYKNITVYKEAKKSKKNSIGALSIAGKQSGELSLK